jgi:hypothetical protein
MKTLRNSSIITLAVVALALLVATPVAFADSTLVYTVTVPSTTTDFTANGLLIPEFNIAGATLNSVSINLATSGTTNFTSITNTSSSSTIFVATENSTIYLGDSTNSSINALLGPTSGSTNYLAMSTPGTVSHGIVISGTTLGAGDSIALGPYTSSDNESNPLITGANLLLFEGSGNLDFYMETLSSDGYNATGGANVSLNEVTDASGTITVTYDYSNGQPPSVPEPGTLSLFGTGLLGLAGMLRYKFMKSR